ncbi:hypothetical protein M1M07_32135 [Rhodococcus sp. HM1]|uniref:hypothetical protein n=1 Tax=unclassified Rhodococcus (in: high G+C Gram-positive bacteria) TaxID=192944 RepID=UPI0018CCD73F|nr:MULTISPECIES: hypothetical protein [unclassified Rhodococcus (in: high G+C Gram-positive bacteria)]MBH0122976.1 hypothetical protein [Rhodococcus sp. CX]MCK8675734.1 hypothetical protein [Rhodococcus sp. HM1]
MTMFAKSAAVTALGAATIAVLAPATATAAGAPDVSVSAQPGAVRVDFDFRGVDVALGVTCITYVVAQQGTLDAAEPSGRRDAQPAGSSFSITNTSTSAATYVGENGPVSAGPRAITPGTYDVFWGCQDAEGKRWENIFGPSGRPFVSPITVTVPGESAATSPSQSSPASGGAAPAVPPAPAAPQAPAGPVALVTEGLQALSTLVGIA